VAGLTEAQAEFLGNPYVGAVTTLRQDGSPHTTVVWVDYDNGQIRFNTAIGRAKERHLRNDPRVAVTVVDPSNAYKWVSISGRGEVTQEGADEHINALSKKYIDKDEYPFREPGEQRVMIRVTPERVDSYGFDGGS
jgi:PPOX class probable F420-dependent enzyme